MRCVVVLVLFGLSPSVQPVRAQVINGEGTYESSSMHEPPAAQPNEPEKSDGVGKTKATSRDRTAPTTKIDRD